MSYSSSLFFLFACICIHLVFSLPSSPISYTEHCSSVVPEKEIISSSITNGNSLPSLSTPYFTGGNTFLRLEPSQTYYYVQKNLRLRLRPDHYQTNTTGVYKVGGFLIIRFPYISDDSPGNYSYGGGYNRRRNGGRGSIRFAMNGFWSESSRKLCMVGSSASWKGIDRRGVLKLRFEDENPTIYSGVVSGSFESIVGVGFFDPIFILSFPTVPNYNYSLLPKQAGAGAGAGAAFSSDSDAGKHESSLSVGTSQFCSVVRRGVRNLELQHSVGLFLRRFLSLISIQCPEGERKARFMAIFHNYTSYSSYGDFDVNSTLIGEVSWDDKNKRMIGVACEISNPSQKLETVVKNCTTRLSLRFPSVLTMRNDAKVVGQIWSSKSVDEFGYFDKISLKDNDEYVVMALPELRYEYTELDRAKKLCPVKKPAKKGNVYPDEHSYDMEFDMNVKNGQDQLLGWAYARPSWVGDDSYNGGHMLVTMSSVETESFAEATPILERERHNNNNTLPTRMSYKIRIKPYNHGNSSNTTSPRLNWTMNPYQGVDIAAEGLYDARNGFLCMVGCRKLLQNSTFFKDCEVVVELEFPPLNGRRGGLIKGKIRSTRATTDALHFDDLVIQSSAHYIEEAERSIWRMDMEIMMVLVSNTLACIFVGLQIFHVKRNPEVPSLISLVMLVILCVGHMIPLVLNFEAVLLGNHDKKTLELGSGGKLEGNEVAVRVITMVALLLYLRLFQVVWTAKLRDSNGKSEKKAGFVSLLVYILGGMITLLLNWMRKTQVIYSVWGDLRSYAGLILDGFLVPQIILNIFRGSAEKALSHPYYMGTSVVRLVPHAYNQYRAHNYPNYDLNATYYYANPAADFYSTAWDIIIPCGVVALAVIVFLQQWLGGRCILPQRLRGLEMYEKVPTADNQ